MAVQVVVEREEGPLLGLPLRRVEDPKFVTGKGRYLDDIKIPKMLYAAFVRSPHAHARITNVDGSRVFSNPAVKAFFTGSDLKDVKPLVSSGEKGEGTGSSGLIGKSTPRPALALEEVNYVGEPIAVVLAEDAYSAEDATELVNIEFEPLPVVTDPISALEAGTPRVHDYLSDNICAREYHSFGDIDGSFRSSHKILKFELLNQRVAGVALEPRGIIADYDAGSGLLTVWSSNQGPQGKREELADILELPLPRVRVRSPDVGGGFGSKLGLHPEDVVVSIASMRICKPVKWVETRTENLLGTGHGRGQKQFVEVAISEVGKIIGLRVKIIHDAGAYSNGSIGVAANTYMMATGAYDISNYSAEIVSVLTNKVPQSPYRGAGRPEASYLIERAINIMTHKYKLDPVKIRQINFIPIEKFPYKSASGLTYDSGDYGKSLRKALLVSNYEQLKREQARALEEGRLIGIGLSSWVEITGFSPNFPQTASITVTATGDVIVAAGGLTNGQGHATTFTQIVGNELGLDPRNIFVFQGDTDMLPWSSVTGGSRSGALTGSAVLLATRKIKAKMSKIAAQVLGVDRDDFLFEGGKIRDRIDTSKSIEFTNIASIAYKPLSLPIGLEPTLFEYAAFAPPNNAFTFGTHISMIEVDKESGVIKLLKYIAVDDCGNILNPMVVEGQAVGGIVQGIGQAIMEEVVYDESGQLLTSTLADYTLPSSQSLPQISWDKTLTPTNSNPLGVKGIGEAGTTAGTPTVVNAVENALSQRDPELVIDCMPLKPEYIVKLMKEIVSRRISS